MDNSGCQFRENDHDVPKDTNPTLSFDDDPSLNPQNWSPARKHLILGVALWLVICSTCGTSLASNSVKATLKEFGYDQGYGWRVFPVSIYLAGYTIGGVIFGPLSEQYGRRTINVLSTLAYTLLMMACALSPNWAVYNVFRFFNGFVSGGPSSAISG